MGTVQKALTIHLEIGNERRREEGEEERRKEGRSLLEGVRGRLSNKAAQRGWHLNRNFVGRKEFVAGYVVRNGMVLQVQMCKCSVNSQI